MKVGDKVFIATGNKREERLSGYQTVSKVGRKYFEISATSWEKFLINIEEEHPEGMPSNFGIRIKDHYTSSLHWYSSREVWQKRERASAARKYISNNVRMLNDDEAIALADQLIDRENLCGTR